MRSDNGAPFASTGAGGLSALSVRLIKAGVLPERMRIAVHDGLLANDLVGLHTSRWVRNFALSLARK